jgi:hypothetical protein
MQFVMLGDLRMQPKGAPPALPVLYDKPFLGQGGEVVVLRLEIAPINCSSPASNSTGFRQIHNSFGFCSAITLFRRRWEPGF